MAVFNLVKGAAVFLLGIVLPVVVLVQAYTTLGSLSDNIARTADPKAALETFKQAQSVARNGNDYALFSQIYAESANQQVVTNKQVIKVAVMQVGFAALSLGLMFVVLGINDGGGEGSWRFLDIRIDFKTASTGALVFTVGAIMTTLGGVLKNEYKTVGAPQYVYAGGPSQAEADSLNAYRTCRAQALPAQFATCFTELYSQVNGESLK